VYGSLEKSDTGFRPPLDELKTQLLGFEKQLLSCGFWSFLASMPYLFGGFGLCCHHLPGGPPGRTPSRPLRRMTSLTAASRSSAPQRSCSAAENRIVSSTDRNPNSWSSCEGEAIALVEHSHSHVKFLCFWVVDCNLKNHNLKVQPTHRTRYTD